MKLGDVYFEVTIKRVEAVEEKLQEWKQVADSGNPKDGGPAYGYVPTTCLRMRERVILHQQVEQLDVNAVVLAVLGITGTYLSPVGREAQLQPFLPLPVSQIIETRYGPVDVGEKALGLSPADRRFGASMFEAGAESVAKLAHAVWEDREWRFPRPTH